MQYLNWKAFQVRGHVKRERRSSISDRPIYFWATQSKSAKFRAKIATISVASAETNKFHCIGIDGPGGVVMFVEVGDN